VAIHMERKNYFFNDFTEANYRRLLNIAKRKYRFIRYEEIDRHDSYILWRHDIDCSPHRSLSLAKIEHKEGISSTHFILLNSNFYNVFEHEIKDILKHINLLGHCLGLHFDASAYPILSKGDLRKWLIFEKRILQSLLNIEIKVFSYHNPNPNILKYNEFRYAGMVNAYSKYFKTEVKYCSDSNGYWRYERLENVLVEGKHPKVQVLTHPEWWQKTAMSPRERISRCIEGRAKKVSLLYDRFLEVNERENIGR